MRGLFMDLPPFAADYSGVGSVFYELDGLIVILDAGGCTGNYAAFDEPRRLRLSSRIFSLGLAELDAVYGVEDSVIEKVLCYLADGASQPNPHFIVLLGTPAPMLVGTDYQAIAHQLEAETGLPVMAFDSTGMASYDVGAEKALLRLAERFIPPSTEKVPRGVILLGATPLDIGPALFERLVSCLRDAGYPLLSSVSLETGFEELASAGQAEASVVCSASGLRTAQYLKARDGIPWMAGLPIGREGGIAFLSCLEETMQQGHSSVETWSPPCTPGKKALIIGEQVFAESLKRSLILDQGFESVDIASFFMLKPELITGNGETIALESESELAALRGSGYTECFGDPLYAPLLGAELCYTGIPHWAVSSRLFPKEAR